MPNKRRKISKSPLKSPSLSPPMETQTKEAASHRKHPPKTKKKPLSKKKLALIDQKLSLLSQNLRPFPFDPNPQALALALAPHEPLFRSLNLWDFLNLRLDLHIRSDLLSHLIANYDPLKHHSLVLGLRINLSRADLGRALGLPSNKALKTTASEFDAAQFGGGDEVAAVLSGFISNRMVLLDDAAILPEEVVTANRLVREGQPNKVDWAGLMWALVEKEILEAPENGSCYYASHLQCLMKYQKPRLFEDAGAEAEMEGVERSEAATVEEEDGDAEVEEVGDVGSEKCGPGLSLRIGGDGDGNKKGEEEEKVVSDGKEDAGAVHGLPECGLNDTAGDLSEEELDKEGSGDGLELCLPGHDLNLSKEEPGEVGRAESAEHSLPESELNYTTRSARQCEEPIKQEPDNGGRLEGVQHRLQDGGPSYTAGASIKEETDKGEGGEADNKGKRVDTGFEDELAAAKFPTLERLTSSDFMQVMGTNNNLSLGLDQSNGELLGLGSDMHNKSLGLDMGLGGSFLFGNEQKRPVDEIDDQVNRFHQNHQPKRFRSKQPWEQTPTITGFDGCMEQLQLLMGKAKMDLVEKEQACMNVQVQMQYLNGVLQQKDELIQSLQKTTGEEMRKRDMEANRFNHDLKTLSNILFGCKKALKDTQTAFDEYRKKFPLDNEPNRECHRTGGDDLGATVLREPCATNEDEMRQIARRMISDFNKSWCGELDKHATLVSASVTKLVQLHEEVKLLKERMAKSKGQNMVEMDSKNINLNVPYKECWHKMRAPVARSNTSRNPGRLLWDCPLWKTNNCHYFRWLPEDASRAYMKVHGLEGVEIVDTADILEQLDNHRDTISTLADENKMLKTRQEELRCQPTNEVERLRMRLEAMVNECQKTKIVYLVFGILLGFILGRM